MVLENICVEVEKEKVMKAVDCRPQSPVYKYVEAEYDKYFKAAIEAINAKAWINFELECCYVVISIGNKISDLSTALFENGEAMAGLLVNAIGDEYVFAVDRYVSEYIKEECAKKGCGVKNRKDADSDIDFDIKKELIEKSGANIQLTDGLAFFPPKSMGYVLELTNDAKIFKAQHDCSKCRVQNCPMRRKEHMDDEFETLTDYSPLESFSDNIVCVDIGTTTVVMEKINEPGKSISFVNPQRRFGADVLARIEASNIGRGPELKNAIAYEILKGTQKLCGNEKPDKIVISANTVMVHLLMGYSCMSLGLYPFTPVNCDTIHTTLGQICGTEDQVPVDIIGCIGAFVGGDITSGIYFCGMAEKEELALFIDLGTNGEMAVGNRNSIITASAAAGPAFEGGGISCGIGSVKGAVCGVDLKQGTIKTIGGAQPCGICGTGIIEAISEMLELGVLDYTGLFNDEYFENGFYIKGDIKITQKDIREIQTAKSAVVSGVYTILHEYGADIKDIKRVYLAGGFGYGLNIDKAQRIGLVPKQIKKDIIEVIGNSSMGGAVKYAANKDAEKEINRIKAISTDIQLGGNEYFAKQYIENINFV